MEIKEFKERKNVHMTHTEDLVLLGQEGLIELNDKFEKFINQLETGESKLNISQKVDGAPALLLLSDVEGYPKNSIGIKSLLSNPKNAISSVREIDAKYGDRPDMAAKLKYGLKLSHCIPKGEIWQGDCLYSKNDLKEVEIGGKSYLTFHPNKIVYAVSEENESYEDIKNSNFGICLHTIYKGGSQTFNVDVSRLNNVPSDIYVMSPLINLSKDNGDFDVDVIKKEFDELKSLEDKLISNPDYEDLCNNAVFMSYWNTFENANLSDKQATTLNIKTFFEDLKDYIKIKKQAEYDKKMSTLKTDAGKEKATTKYQKDIAEMEDLLNNNKSLLTDLVKCLNKATEIKMILWEGFKKFKPDYSSFYKHKEKGYIPANIEGIAMSDADGNVVKIVDRSTFSNANRDPNYLSGFDHNESLEPAWVKNTVNKANNTDANPAVKATKEYHKMKLKKTKPGQMFVSEGVGDCNVDPDIFNALSPEQQIYVDYTDLFINKEGNQIVLSDWENDMYFDNIDELKSELDYGIKCVKEQGLWDEILDIKESLTEGKTNDTAVLAWGRMNPPTIAHKMLVDEVVKAADKIGATPMLYLSHSNKDKEHDPLPYDRKAYYANKAFGDVFVKSDANTIILVLKDIQNKGYKNLVYLCGSDRVAEMENLMSKYNGVPDKNGEIPFNFKKIEVRPIGEERVDEDIDLKAVSASKVRKTAKEGNFDLFKEMVPFDETTAKELYDELRSIFGIIEESVELGEAQSDIKGQMTITSKGKNKTYSVYFNSGNSYGVNMGEDRFYDSWVGESIDQIALTLDGKKYLLAGDEINIKSNDGHVVFVLNVNGKKLSFTGHKGTGRSGAGFPDKYITGYQEAIMGLILKGAIPSRDIEDYLSKSIIKRGKSYKLANVFELGLIPHVSVDDNYYEGWQIFVKSWSDALQVVQNTKNNFYAALPAGWKATDIKRSRLLHERFGDGTFINKKDVYDKSDIYYCLDESVISELSNSKNASDYCKIAEDAILNKRILGVSLKRPEGKSIICKYDIQGYNPTESFDKNAYIEYHYTRPDKGDRIKTVNLRLIGVSLDDPVHFPILEVRSDSDSGSEGKAKFALQWKFNKAQAWAGKGKEAFRYQFGDEAYKEVTLAAIEKNYIKCANIILNYLGINIDEEYLPSMDEHFKMNKAFKTRVSAFMNLSMGFNSRNEKSERLTAPYVKVY